MAGQGGEERGFSLGPGGGTPLARGLGPGRVGEGDAVELGPGREDPLLGDEAVMVALPAVLVLDVGDTLIGPLRLIVVVGHALQAGPLAGVEDNDMSSRRTPGVLALSSP